MMTSAHKLLTEHVLSTHRAGENHNKGCCKKNHFFLKFGLSISVLKQPLNFKIILTTPHNTPIIMWGYRQEL